MQSLSVVLPASEFEFEGHAVHVSLESAAIESEYVFASHSLHAAEPVSLLYVPALQAVHSAPSWPVYPVMQVHLSMLLLPASERVYAGHSVHVLCSSSGDTPPYVPAAHGVQTVVPSM